MNKLNELLNQNPNILFLKKDCGYCAATSKLADRLVRYGLIDRYKEVFLDQDFTIEELTEFVAGFGHELVDGNVTCSNPQVFIKGEYIGGNNDFYKSKWNKGENKSGKLAVNGEDKETPNLFNTMNV